jgi:hypothetical protein
MSSMSAGHGPADSLTSQRGARPATSGASISGSVSPVEATSAVRARAVYGRRRTGTMGEGWPITGR